MLALGPALCAATSAPCSDANGDGDRGLYRFVRQTYGESIEFDVQRKGKKIGSHVTSFSKTESGLTAVSRTSLNVKVLFVPVYEFTYTSRSHWCAGQLRYLEAIVSDNGELSATTVLPEEGKLIITNGDGRLEALPDILPTEHWNPRVLEHERVLNTITGRVNKVSIEPCRSDSVIVKAAAPNARCYEYEGDLQTRVWYDERGRWAGLEFNGTDGTAITYVCRGCRDNR